MNTKQQTTWTEACFLFACSQTACPPQLCEERQMPRKDSRDKEKHLFLFWIILFDFELLIEFGEEQ